MKSVKEKSNEYAKEYLFSPLPQRAPNVHFEAGAKYVLDAIQSCIDRHKDGCVAFGAIILTIGILKGE